MNRGQITSLMAGFAEDPSQTRYAGLYNDAADRAQEQFALETKCLFKDASTYTVVNGTSSYSLPTDFMFEKQITHKGIALLPISRATLLYYKTSDWTTDTGTPKYYMIDPEEARKTMLLYPQPTADDAGVNLILTYYPVPASMSADSSTPLNGSALLVQFHMALAAYGAWMLLSNAVMTPEIKEKRQSLLGTYKHYLEEARNTFGNTISEPWRLKGGRDSHY